MGCVVGKAWNQLGDMIGDHPYIATGLGLAVPVIGVLELGAWLSHDDIKPPNLNKDFKVFNDGGLSQDMLDAITLPSDGQPSFKQLLEKWKTVDDHPSPAPLGNGLYGTADALNVAVQKTSQTLEHLADSEISKGSMNAAFIKNLSAGLTELGKWAGRLLLLQQCVNAYHETMHTTKYNVLDAEDSYNAALKIVDDETAVNKVYDKYATDVMTVYTNNIKLVSSHHPAINAADPAPVQPNVPGPTNRGGGGGGPGGSKTGSGTPKITSPSNLLGKNNPFKQTSNNKSTPNIPTDALSGLGNAAQQAAQQAGNAAGSAAGQAADAAKQALEQALNGKSNGTTGLPEGVLGGIGSNALGGLNKAGGAGGGRGGGSASGSRPTVARPAANTTAASKAPVEAAAKTSRAGVSGTGAAGSGAPAAGHRGGGTDKVHKANKALRHMRNGQEVMGETDAVVSVLGEEPQQAAPTKTT
ncbi:MAG: hypothetical protein H6523_15070 [Mycolicibacterium sp.]|nr:hypothetical protein [Mycolicibacterium sp.]